MAGFQSTARLLPLTANLTMAISVAAASASTRPSLISGPKPSTGPANVSVVGSDWNARGTKASPESMRIDGLAMEKNDPSSNQKRTSGCGA